MPTVNLDDTIAAIATPPGEGAIGIVRLSGKDSIPIASRMFIDPADKKLENVPSHTARYGDIYDQNGNVIDQVLVTVFRKPHSYTTEDVVEIGAHGGTQVLSAILNLALSLGARQAEPGEFTKRAFLNGRIDLTQAEAVLDLIRAKTDGSARVALRQLVGKLSDEVTSLKDLLMALCAHFEAYLDFPDDHLEVFDNEKFKDQYQTITAGLERLIASFAKGRIMREGALIVIIGRPNVGKSSLLNALLERDRAIVSDIPGTTRDTLEESISLEGSWIRLVDTAGLASSSHPLDQAAMERTKRYLLEGDLFLLVLDAIDGCLTEDEKIAVEIKGKNIIVVANKIDQPNNILSDELKKKFGEVPVAFISAKTREGIDQLEKAIIELVVKGDVNSESTVITHLRHKRALEFSLAAVKKSFAAFSNHESLEFVTVELKAALGGLREMIGEVYTEDLLDVIFRKFCIGK